MNTAYLGMELRRVVRDPVVMFFTSMLPAFMYWIFGAAMNYGDFVIGEGNVAMLTMINMACYGAVTATVGIGGMAAVERMQGWGRQLGLTPMSDWGFVSTKASVSVVIAAVPVTLVYLSGAVSGAEAPGSVWAASTLITLGGASLFSFYGLAVGLAFRSESAISAASGGLVIMGFLGNVFVPLSGVMLDIARFTPLYGYAALARYPLTHGQNASMSSAAGTFDPLWLPLLNVGVWTCVFAGACVLLVRRSRGRQ